MTQVVVSGALGRLGSQIVRAALAAPDLVLRAAVVRPGSKHDGRPLAALMPEAQSQLAATGAIESALESGAVLVETAASAQVALEHGALAAARGCPLLVATTGYSAKDREALSALGRDVPVLLAPNLSLGVTVLSELVRQASAALAAYDLEIVELHHNKKKDAPSGTAWALARAAAEARGQDAERDAILARAGDIGPRGRQEIGIQTLRGGEVVGEHTVFLFGPTERLELTHRAQSREAFAQGALQAVRFLGASGRAARLYSMLDVVGLSRR